MCMVCVHTYMYICVYIYTYKYMLTWICVYIEIKYVCMETGNFWEKRRHVICMACVCVCVCVCVVSMHIYTHIHHTYIIHTYMGVCSYKCILLSRKSTVIFSYVCMFWYVYVCMCVLYMDINTYVHMLCEKLMDGCTFTTPACTNTYIHTLCEKLMDGCTVLTHACTHT